MKQEDKVPLREQCQKLVELGVVLETEHIWFMPAYDPKRAYVTAYSQRNSEIGSYIPAPDIAELGELLPYNLSLYGTGTLYMYKVEKFATIPTEYEYGITYPGLYRESYKTEAQARCAALIWLIENGYLNIKDIKL